MEIKLYKGDCLEIMDELIDKGIKVDAIITDPPYGTTDCKWDSIIPFDEMWLRLNKLIKPNGAIVLFGSEPFSSLLRVSNLKNFKYDWIWNKKQSGSFFNAKYQPLKISENIHIFSNSKCLYYPQMRKGKLRTKGGAKKEMKTIKGLGINHTTKSDLYYPINIIEVSTAGMKSKNEFMHPTQKPVALMEYLIKTYTNENELVLDFTMGSGSTGVACKNTNRNFIGIELDENYFKIAENRINNSKVVKNVIKDIDSVNTKSLFDY
ncbi:MAG: site-specific DNA-methyltransferase [Spirochaetia bacterium]|nr:site-specific DNA-methyltransferase [Spirochaetia bacterium]